VELNQTVGKLWKHAIANKTREYYNVGYKHFERFMLLNNVHLHVGYLPPISEEILIYFVAYCFRHLNLQYSTIKLYLCGIRYKYLQSNVQSPFEKPDQSNLKKLALVLKSVKRLQGAMPRIRLPITFDILEKICYRLRKGVFNNFVDCLIETTCTVAFFGFLRCGEFTVRKASDFDVTVNLCISDVLFYDDYAVLKLKESKTDPFRRGICIQLHKINHSICPFLILQKYIASRIERRIYSSSCDPLFITEFGQPLDRNYFIGKLKHVLQLVGYDSSLYNGHSFRSGGATSAGQALIEDNMIKTLGRWSSQSYCTYIKASKNTIKQAQQSLTNSSVDKH
jgi:hypothetical protein